MPGRCCGSQCLVVAVGVMPGGCFARQCPGVLLVIYAWWLLLVRLAGGCCWCVRAGQRPVGCWCWAGSGGCWCWSKSWLGLWWGMLAGCCCWSMLVLLVSQLRLVKCRPISSVVVFAQFSEV